MSGMDKPLTDRERVTAMSAAYPDATADLTWAEIGELLSPSSNGSGEQVSRISVDALANEIRRVDGDDEASLSAGALAEALMPFLSASMAGPVPETVPPDYSIDHHAYRVAHIPEPVVAAPAPALPEAKPVASPADGEAVTRWGFIFEGNGETVIGLGVDPQGDWVKFSDVADICARNAKLDREAATREAVIEGDKPNG